MAAEPLTIVPDPLPPEEGPLGEPAGTPKPDPPILIVGRDLVMTWEHVYDFVRDKVIQDVPAVTSVDIAITKVLPIIQSYVGNTIKSLGGIINNVADYAHTEFHNIYDDLTNVWDWATAFAEASNTALFQNAYDINDIKNATVPALEFLITQAAQDGITEAHIVGLDVEQWSKDNIFDPLHDTIGKVEADTTQYTRDVANEVQTHLQDVINANQASMLEHLAPIAAAAAAANKWIDDCGEPMCETMGPATDLFKLLKALAIAGDLALLAEFLNLDKAGAEGLVSDAVHTMGTIINDFDQFVTGGETIGGFLGRVASAAL